MTPDELRRRLGVPLIPANTLWCLSLQLAVESGLPWQDSRWAVRAELDADGTARLRPLFVGDVPAFVEASWWAELPTPYLFSVEAS